MYEYFYFNKYKKYKTKYLNFNKLQYGGVNNEIKNKAIENGLEYDSYTMQTIDDLNKIIDIKSTAIKNGLEYNPYTMQTIDNLNKIIDIRAMEEKKEKDYFNKYYKVIKNKIYKISMLNLITCRKVDNLENKISDSPGLNIDKRPIYTNGIFTCIGIGVHFLEHNYFEHIYPHDYTNIKSDSISNWKKILKSINNECIYIYALEITDEHIPFLMMFEELNKFNNLRFIRLDIDIDVFNKNNKIGIDHKGPWYYLENTNNKSN